MKFTKGKIQNYCMRGNEIEEGDRLFKNRYVTNLRQEYERDEIEDRENIAIYAIVNDGQKRHKVLCHIDEEDKIFNWNCDCSHYVYLGLCKHAVATLLEYSLQLEKGIIKRQTSARIRELIFDMALKSKNEVFKKNLANEIEIAPKIVVDDSVGVEFKVGRDKKYVVKDIIEFADCINNQESVEYGKNLSFIHSREAFRAEDREIIDLILEYSETYVNVMLDNKYWGGHKKLRRIALGVKQIDRFISLVTTNSIEVKINGREAIYNIKYENPDVKIYVDKNVNGAFVYREDVAVCAGLEHMYIFLQEERIIYVTDKQYLEDMENILNVLPSYKMESAFLSESDFQSFWANIVSGILKHCTVISSEIDFDEYMPPDTVLKVYIDSTENNEPFCKVNAIYGDKEYNICEKFNPVMVYRDIKAECSAYVNVKKYFPIEKEEEFWMESEDNLFELFNEGIEVFNNEIGEVYVSDRFKGMKIIKSPKVNVGVSVSNDLLELTLDIESLPPDQIMEVLKSYKRRKKYYRLKDGQFVSLMDNSLATLVELSDGLQLTPKQFNKKGIVLQKNRALYLDKVLRESTEEVKYHRDNYFKDIVKSIKSIEDSEFEVPDSLKDVLRGYQKTGFRFIRTLAKYGFGGILADDMGLGKTIQVIAVLLSMKEEEKATSLIVCPASLIYNWESEIQRFAKGLNALVITGSADERKELLKDYQSYDILITSYDLLKRDVEIYNNIVFDMQIIDEAQYIKNHSTQAAKAVKAISAKSKFALTGTPIENKLSELWSIFDYLMTGLLYSYNKFRSELEAPIVQDNDETALKRLQKLIGPFILRRLKKDVLKDLPDKLENVVYSKMEGEQLKLYNANVSKLKAQLEDKTEEEFNSNKMQVLAELTKLRQICCDPSLYYDEYKGESAKLMICLDLIKNAVDGGHKILLFSQFTTMFTILEPLLKQENITYYMLTGGTPKSKRQQMVDRFNNDNTNVFLISLKAGGTGLNLTAADIVIHYDPWWNVAAQNQATDRVHRIGQKNVVSVFKLIAKDSIEEKILDMQEKKKDLSDKIMSIEGISTSNISKEEFLDILS